MENYVVNKNNELDLCVLTQRNVNDLLFQWKNKLQIIYVTQPHCVKSIKANHMLAFMFRIFIWIQRKLEKYIFTHFYQQHVFTQCHLLSKVFPDCTTQDCSPGQTPTLVTSSVSCFIFLHSAYYFWYNIYFAYLVLKCLSFSTCI